MLMQKRVCVALRCCARRLFGAFGLATAAVLLVGVCRVRRLRSATLVRRQRAWYAECFFFFRQRFDGSIRVFACC